MPPFSNASVTVTDFDEFAVAVSVPAVAVPTAAATAGPVVSPARVPIDAVCTPGSSAPSASVATLLTSGVGSASVAPSSLNVPGTTTKPGGSVNCTVVARAGRP